MSLKFRLALLPLLLPPSLAFAQAPARALRSITPGTDTLDLLDAGPVRVGAPLTYMVRTIALGTGADAGAIIEIIRTESRDRRTAKVTLVALDTNVANATDLRLRRAHNLRFDGDGGRQSLEATSQVRGLVIENHLKATYQDTTSSTRIASADQTPIGSEWLMLQAAELSPGWRPRLPTWNGKANDLSATTVDSTWIGTVGGRRAWMVDMHPALYAKYIVAIDSITHDVLRMDLRAATSGTPAGSMVTRRIRGGANGSASAMSPQPAAGTLPSTLAGVPRLPRLDSPDTVEFEVSGMPQAKEKTFRSLMVRSFTLGRGDSAGLLIRATESVQTREDGGMDLRTSERSTVDARTFAFRGLRRRTYLPSGSPLIETRHDLIENRIRGITIRADGKADTVFSDMPVGGAPFATIDDLLRTAPLSRTFRGVFEMYNGAPPFHMPLVVDSVHPLRASSQRLAGAQWSVYAHTDSAGATLTRMEAIVDSATRDVVFLEWKRREGIRSVYVNRRFLPHAGAAGSVAPAGKAGKAEQAAAGHFYLEGVREVGSEILLRPDGRFQYALAYGALDESGEGSWRVENGTVVLQSDGAPRPPTVVLQSSKGKATDSITVFVNDTLGRPLTGVEIDFVIENSGTKFEHTRQGRFTHHFDRTEVPVEIAVGYDIAGFMQTFDLKRPPAAEYHFVFDKGDLGTRRFDGERLLIEKDAIVMTRNNRQMRYVRR